jgi:hypothetical protein
MGTKHPVVRYGGSRTSRWACVSPDPDIDPDDGYNVKVEQHAIRRTDGKLCLSNVRVTINYECVAVIPGIVRDEWQMMARGVKRALQIADKWSEDEWKVVENMQELAQ